MKAARSEEARTRVLAPLTLILPMNLGTFNIQLTIRFDDADTITTSCKAIMDGKEMEEKPTTLRRVKL